MSQYALVTGATGGIGQAIARALAEHGYSVAIGYNQKQQKAQNIVNSLAGKGHLALQCSVDQTSSIKQASQTIQETFGSLDILVNCAGFTQFIEHSQIQELSDDLIDSIFQTHVRGTFACIREFEYLFNQNACVVNITSIAGESAMGSNIAYCAAKAAVDNMTKSLARALAPKIRVMAVAPGLVDTEFVKDIDPKWRHTQEQSTTLKRLANPKEVAEAVIACAKILTFSTGRTIYIDGGRHLG